MELLPMAELVLKQSVKAHGPLVIYLFFFWGGGGGARRRLRCTLKQEISSSEEK